MGTREVAQRNGLLGGRPKGSIGIPKNVKLAAKKAVEDFFAAHAMKLAEEQIKIALHGQFEPTRLQACDKTLDRILGKTIQPHEGHFESNLTLTVITGVPRSRGKIIEHVPDNTIHSSDGGVPGGAADDAREADLFDD